MAQRRNIYPWTLKEMLHRHRTEEEPPEWIPSMEPWYSPWATEALERIPRWPIVQNLAASQILILDWEILQAAGDGEVAMPNGNEFELIDSFITGPVDVYAFTGPEEEALRELGGHYLHVIAATQLIDSPWELTEGTNQLLRSAFSAIRILTHPHLRIPEEKKWTLHSALHQMLEGTSVLFGWRTAMEIGEIWWHRLHSMLAWFKEEHGKVEFDH